MNKFVVLIFSLSAYYSPSTGQPDHFNDDLLVLPFDHSPRPKSAQADLNLKGRNCNYNFCEDYDGYPSDEILNILSQTNEFDKLFNTFVPVLGERLPEEENLCGATMNITYPKVGTNVEDKVRFIVNLNSYKQGIVMETCRENSECQFSDSLPLGIKTFCKQRHSQIRLLALDDNKKPAMDVFPAPSCCVCMYKKS